MTKGDERPAGLNRISSFSLDPGSVDFLSYYYLVPCVEKAGKEARGRLLDIGCGNKPYQSLFQSVTEYVGCDIVQSSLNKVDILSTADNIPLPDGTFDNVLSTQTIEHVANFPGLLREAFRLLKPNGRLFLSGPMYWYHHEEPYDFFRFTRHGFRYAVEQAGFVADAIEPNGGKWSVLGLVLLHTLPQKFRGRRRVIRYSNSFFLKLDKRNFDPINTSNFFVFAHRP